MAFEFRGFLKDFCKAFKGLLKESLGPFDGAICLVSASALAGASAIGLGQGLGNGLDPGGLLRALQGL